jgi:hypothetical protein
VTLQSVVALACVHACVLLRPNTAPPPPPSSSSLGWTTVRDIGKIAPHCSRC